LERVHIDWAQEPKFGNIFIIVDTGTNYIDAIICNERSAETVRKCLYRVFALFRILECLVSDKPEFLCHRNWLDGIGCKYLNTPTYHPQSNGATERAVGTIKKAIKSWVLSAGNKFCYLQKILLNHRSASGGLKTSPAFRMFGRNIRNTCNKEFQMEDKVLYKHSNMNSARKVEIISPIGSNTSLVKDSTKSWIASHDQLAKSPRNSEQQTFRN